MSVETTDYLAMVRRMIRAAGKRVAWCDEDELRELSELTAEVDAALRHAVERQRDRGVSWAGIGGALGITRQSAQQRFGSSTRLPSAPGEEDTPLPGL